MLSPQITIHSKTQFPPITEEITTENDAIHLSYGLGWGLRHAKGINDHRRGGKNISSL